MGNQEEKIKAIPMGDSPQDRRRRNEIYNGFDVNGNGFLSLAEVDKGIRDVLNLPQLFDTKPVIMRAFQASKKKMKSKSPHGDDYVSKGEFRFLLCYLRLYYFLWEQFDHVDIDNDRRVSETQFINGAPKLILDIGILIPNPKDTFQRLLTRYKEKAHITFTDFCDWVIQKHLKFHQAERTNHLEL